MFVLLLVAKCELAKHLQSHELLLERGYLRNIMYKHGVNYLLCVLVCSCAVRVNINCFQRIARYDLAASSQIWGKYKLLSENRKIRFGGVVTDLGYKYLLWPSHHDYKKNKKKPPWSESASELYRPSDRRLSPK
jgi:hypothetical protein